MRQVIKTTTETRISLDREDLLSMLTSTKHIDLDVPEHARVLFPFPDDELPNDITQDSPLDIFWTTQTEVEAPAWERKK